MRFSAVRRACSGGRPHFSKQATQKTSRSGAGTLMLSDGFTSSGREGFRRLAHWSDDEPIRKNTEGEHNRGKREGRVVGTPAPFDDKAGDKRLNNPGHIANVIENADGQPNRFGRSASL